MQGKDKNAAFGLPRDMTFEMARKFMPYGFGSLWWGRDDLIHSKHSMFVERTDRIGHPLLSVMRQEFKSRCDSVPMFVGTSGTSLRARIKKRCVKVKGLTEDEPEHASYFGSIIKPGIYGFEELLDGIVKKRHAFRHPAKQEKDAPTVASERVPWYDLRVMSPNTYKSHVNEAERRELERFCARNGLQ